MVYGQNLTNAETNLEINNNTNLKNELDKLENEYKNFEFEIIPEYEITTKQPTLKFDTVKDFKNYLKANRTEVTNQETIINLDENGNISNRSYNSVKTFSKWAPYNIFNILCYFNTDINYEYNTNRNGKYFVGVNYVSSYLSGLNVAIDWIQTSYSSTIKNSGKELQIKINGYFYNYVDIDGITVGFKDKQTQTFIGKFN